MDFTRVSTYLDSLEEKYQIHGLDCLIMKDHEQIYRHMCGCSDYAQKKPVNGTELYDIFSASKIATMTAVMQLVEQGKIGLEDPVTKYLPEFSDMYYDPSFKFEWPPKMPTRETAKTRAEAPILIWQLMSMTGGLGYDTESEPIRELQEKSGFHATTREMMTALAKTPLLYAPGTHYAYSLGHDVLAGVVEVVSGMTFGEYQKKHIFDPLGMKETWYHVPEGMENRLFAQYAFNMSGELEEAPGNNYRLTDRYDSGGAGIVTTVADYIRLLDALACGGTGLTGARILTEESVKAIGTNRLNAAQIEEFQQGFRIGYGYGLGVRVHMEEAGAKSPVGEFGWDGAAGAYALIDPVNHLSLYYGQQVRNMFAAYSEIHPALRDLVYESLE